MPSRFILSLVIFSDNRHQLCSSICQKIIWIAFNRCKLKFWWIPFKQTFCKKIFSHGFDVPALDDTIRRNVEYVISGLRKSSTSIFVEGCRDLLSPKWHGGWISSTAADSYIDESINKEIKIPHEFFDHNPKISKDNMITWKKWIIYIRNNFAKWRGEAELIVVARKKLTFWTRNKI